MKIRISDLMDQMEAVPVEIAEDPVSAEKIKEDAQRKLHSVAPKRRGARRGLTVGLAAAAFAALLGITAGAAVRNWNGFAFTSGMGGQEKQALLEEASMGTAGEWVDADGMVHYLVENGGEPLVLTAEEAAAYEQARQADRDRAVVESTTLVDASTMELLPKQIVELPVGEDGELTEFALGNGSMVLLYPEGETGYDLRTGDKVTIALEAGEECYLAFGLFRDGVFVEAETVRARAHSYTFSIREDGSYCFYVEYFSASADEFTNGQLLIE